MEKRTYTKLDSLQNMKKSVDKCKWIAKQINLQSTDQSRFDQMADDLEQFIDMLIKDEGGEPQGWSTRKPEPTPQEMEEVEAPDPDALPF